MDRLESMTTFLAAVEAGSLSAASRALKMPLATVSRKVSELEAHLKTRLVNRTSRRLTLTDAGRSYLAACKRILENIDEAERAASGEYSAPRGDLVITAPVVFGRLHVLPLVTGFLKAYPEIDARLVLADRVFNLQEEGVDLAVRIGELPDSNLIAARVGGIRQIVCASPAFCKEHGTPKHPADLSRHPCITFEGMTSQRSWKFAVNGKSVTVPVRSRLIVNNAEAAVDAAAASVGIARVLSYQAATALRARKLVRILRKFEPMPSPINLVYAGQGRLPIKLRAFIDYATPRLRKKLAEIEV
jgi:DNA-binding transcriptional LysR family regulator